MGEVISFDRQRFSSIFPAFFRHVEEDCWNLYNDLKRANIKVAEFYSEYDHEIGDQYLCLEILPNHSSQMATARLISSSYRQHLHKRNVDLMLVSHGVFNE
jgi:hypothetical protein